MEEGSNTVQIDVTASDGFTTMSYTLTLTRQMEAQFAQTAYVKASNADAGDYFGWSVALSGDTLAVGARRERSAATGIGGDQEDNTLIDAGAVYVFTRDGAGVWSQQAYIKASNTDADDEFGASVALSGDTLAVGASRDASAATGINGDQGSDSAPGSGAVYVYARDSTGIWSQQAYIKASNTGAYDRFGQSIALTGDALAVGATGEESSATGVNGDQGDHGVFLAGAAYVFRRNSEGFWSQEAYIKASETDAGDAFGMSIALAGDTLAVGSGDDSAATGINGNPDDASAGGAGAVHVFIRDESGIWSLQAYVKASNTDADDRFGGSITLSGDTLVVGAVGEDSAATGVNSDQGDNNASFSGAVYVFVRDSAAVWSQQGYIKASNTEGADQFGTSVSLSGDTLVVSASEEDSGATGIDGDQADNNANSSGAVYVFMRDVAGVWSQQAYIKASNTGRFDDFGSAVVLSFDTLAVGTPLEDSSASGIDGDQSDNSAAEAGTVYVFK